LVLRPDALLAASEGVGFDVRWKGARSYLPGEGFRFLVCQGSATDVVILAACGAFHTLELKQEEEYLVDIAHFVAAEESVRFRVRHLGGVKQAVTSQEGFVFSLQGAGRVYIQSHKVSE
jgi:uncharacterized protein (AIM24 family)